MKTLKVGDIRQKGDEVRHTHKPDEKHRWTSNFTGDGPQLYDWNPVLLVGHPILSSDLMIAEFRRP
jgi:hypothetical protein